MRLTYWVLLIALVLLIAAAVYLLTRKPSAPREDQEVSDYGPGGSRVAAGDAGAQPVSAAPLSAETSSTQDAPYDQETDRGERAEVTPEEGDADDSVPKTGYTDTATGEEVQLEDEEAQEDEGAAQEDTRDPVEPAPVEEWEHRGDSAAQPEEPAAERHDDAAAVTYGAASPVGEDTAYAVPAHRAHDSDHDSTGDDAAHAPAEVHADSPGPESQRSHGSTAYTTAEETDHGHPDPQRPPTDEATDTPGHEDPVLHRQADDDDRARTDEPIGQQAAELVEHEAAGREVEVDRSVDDEAEHDEDRPVVEHDAQPQTAPAWDEHDDDVPSDATAAGFEPPPSPYGPGTALPAEDGAGPEGWAIKGNAGSMLFHTPDSPSYAESRAEVWFESEQAARAAGFAHWDRRRR